MEIQLWPLGGGINRKWGHHSICRKQLTAILSFNSSPSRSKNHFLIWQDSRRWSSFDHLENLTLEIWRRNSQHPEIRTTGWNHFAWEIDHSCSQRSWERKMINNKSKKFKLSQFWCSSVLKFAICRTQLSLSEASSPYNFTLRCCAGI